MSNQAQYMVAAVATAGAIGGAYIAYKTYKDYRERARIPTEWTQVGTLSDLYAYPIKSNGPVMLDSAEVTTLGLKNGWLRDRVLMVVDEEKNFVTARAHPQLLLVQPTVRNSVLTLKHPHMEDIHVNLAEIAAEGKLKTASVWNTPVPVYDCGYGVAEWYSRLISNSKDNFRLVYYASQDPRPNRLKNYMFYNLYKKDTGALTDEISFNLVNQASVDDLNTHLKDTKVSHRNFRPNFVLRGAKPYDEDNWKFLKIGDSIFEVVKPCLRCVLTTIDPETGARNQADEPLKSLKAYRLIADPEERRAYGTLPKMGVQVALRSSPGGKISLNDPIYVAYNVK